MIIHREICKSRLSESSVTSGNPTKRSIRVLTVARSRRHVNHSGIGHREAEPRRLETARRDDGVNVSADHLVSACKCYDSSFSFFWTTRTCWRLPGHTPRRGHHRDAIATRWSFLFWTSCRANRWSMINARPTRSRALMTTTKTIEARRSWTMRWRSDWQRASNYAPPHAGRSPRSIRPPRRE